MKNSIDLDNSYLKRSAVTSRLFAQMKHSGADKVDFIAPHRIKYQARQPAALPDAAVGGDDDLG